jgi:hypothetical protein
MDGEAMNIGFLWILEMAMIILGILFAGLGLFGLIRKRPVLMRNVYSVGTLILMDVLVLGQIILDPILVADSRNLELPRLLTSLFFTALLIGMVLILVRQLPGYVLSGIREGITEDIAEVLKAHQMQFKIQSSKIILPEYGSSIQVAVLNWMGTAQIRNESKERRDIFQKIVRGIDAYYNDNKNKQNNSSLGTFLRLGIVLVVEGVFFLAFSLGFRF